MDPFSAMRIVPLYASLLAFLFVALSIRTLRMRRRLRIAVGDDGNLAMLRAMRVHSNFAEYVPFGLLLLAFVEMGGANAWYLHAMGLALFVGRAAHAYGVSQVKENFAFRVLGMTLTFISLLSCAVTLLVRFLA